MNIVEPDEPIAAINQRGSFLLELKPFYGVYHETTLLGFYDNIEKCEEYKKERDDLDLVVKELNPIELLIDRIIGVEEELVSIHETLVRNGD